MRLVRAWAVLGDGDRVSMTRARRWEATRWPSLGLIPVSEAVTLFPECVRNRRTPGVAFRELEGSVTTVTCGFLRRSGDVAPVVERFLKMRRTVKAKRP